MNSLQKALNFFEIQTTKRELFEGYSSELDENGEGYVLSMQFIEHFKHNLQAKIYNEADLMNLPKLPSKTYYDLEEDEQVQSEYFVIPKKYMTDYSHLNIILKNDIKFGKDYIVVGRAIQSIIMLGSNLRFDYCARKKSIHPRYYEVQVCLRRLRIMFISQEIMQNLKRSQNIEMDIPWKYLQVDEQLKINELKKILTSIHENISKNEIYLEEQTNLKFYYFGGVEDVYNFKDCLLKTAREQSRPFKIKYLLHFMPVSDSQLVHQVINLSDHKYNTVVCDFFTQYEQKTIIIPTVSKCNICSIHISPEKALACETCNEVYYCSEKCYEKKGLNHTPNCNSSKKSVSQLQTFSHSSPAPKISNNPKRGICGLRNMGNTCYMNTCLQLLCQLKDVREYFLDSKKKYGKISDPLSKLMRVLWEGDKSYVEPIEFRNRSDYHPVLKLFEGNLQQDAHEYLTFLLDALHEENKESAPWGQMVMEGQKIHDNPKIFMQHNIASNNSIIQKQFGGLFCEQTICESCKKMSTVYSIFHIVDLQIPAVKPPKNYSIVFLKKYNFSQPEKIILETQHFKNVENIEDFKKVLYKIYLSNSIANFNKMFVYMMKSKHAQHFDDLMSFNELRKELELSPTKNHILVIGDQYLNQLNIFYPNIIIDLTNDHTQFPIKLPIFLPKYATLGHIYNLVSEFLKPILNNSAGFDKQADVKIYLCDGEIDTLNFSFMCEKPNCQGCFECDLKPTSNEFLSSLLESFQKKYIRILVKLNFSSTQNYSHYFQLKVLKIGLTGALEKEVQHFNMFKAPDLVKDVAATSISITDCLDAFQKQEDLGNCFFCDNCQQLVNAKKKISIFFAPPILILSLKRFNGQNLNEKINTEIDCPMILYLNSCIRSEDYNKIGESNFEKKSLIYKLKVIINHKAGLGGGHYTCYCYNDIYKKWFFYDDSQVSEVDPKTSMISKDTYILAYQR